MALAVDAEAERAVALAAPPEAVWARLAHVPDWQPLFPNVNAMTPRPGAPGVFETTMAPMGPPGYAVQTAYACRYTFAPADGDAARGGEIAWEPAEPDAPTRFAGRLVLRPDGAGGTRGALRLAARLEIPAPRLARPLVEPAVRLAVGHTVDTFLARLADAVRASGERPAASGA